MARRVARVASVGTTVVSVDETAFKLVRVAHTVQGRLVTAVQVIPLPAGAEEPPEMAIRTALGAARVALGSVWVAIPSYATTVRLLTLPSTNPQEIRDIVDLQLEKHTPHAREEILADVAILDSDPSGYSRVLLAIAHRDVAQRAVTVAEAAGGLVDRVGCEVEGLVTWFRLAQRKLAQPPAGAVLLADVGLQSTTLLILQQGQPVFHRSIGSGLAQLAEGGGDSAALLGEFQRSLEAAEAEGLTVSSLSEVVLVGSAERLGGLLERVQPVLGVPGRIVPVFEFCPSTAEAAVAGAATDCSLAGLVGLALGAVGLDLTPPTVQLRKAFAARVRALMVVGYQLVGILLLLLAVALEKTYAAQRQLAALTQEQQVVSPKAERVAQALDQLSTVKQRLPRRGVFLDVLDAVSRLIPPGSQLNSVTYAARGEVVLKGVSEELPKVYEFVSELGKIPVFAKVEPRRVSKRKIEAQDITDFEISCEIP